jgi:S-formylglutathione hydrolase FrmB
MARVVSCSLSSRLNKKDIPYRVMLPASYGQREQRFPALYLLHGLFGNCDNWTELTGMLDYVERYDLVVVAPNGGDNWYTDSETSANQQFESVLVQELIPEIENDFRVSRHRDGRAIAGISMGGYGAFKFALKWPELFAFAASCSGAFSGPTMCRENCNGDWPEYSESIMRVFGPVGSRTRLENELGRIVAEMSEAWISEMPQFYMACGDGDKFVETNRSLAGLMASRGYSVDYHEGSGGHDWAYWDGELRSVLDAAARIVATPGETASV